MLSFDAEILEEEVTIGGQKYVLREPSAEAGAKLRAARQTAITRDEETGKALSVDQVGIEKSDAVLVGECLYAVSPEGVVSETPVGQDFEHLKRDIVVQGLFRKLEEWRQAAKPKNSPSSTPTKSE